MSDLDDDLLALAGGDEEAEEGEASDAVSPANSLGSGAMDESDSSRDSSPAPESAVMFPLDGIFRNARDKAYILALPQVKREEILAEREDQKQQQNFSAQLARRAKQAERDAQGLENKHKRKASSAELEENQRKNSRPKVKANQPLEAYKRQREQRDQLRERQNSHRNRARRGSSASKGSPDDSPRGGSSDVEWDEAAKAAQHNREHSPPNTNHYDAVRVGRLDFHETWSYPSFEKAMIGAFCRVGSGLDQATGRTLYRMAQIKGFHKGKPYCFEGKGDRSAWTDQYVDVQYGNVKKDFPFQYLSNGHFTESDVEGFKRAQAENNLRLPTRSFLIQKHGDIQALRNTFWTKEAVEYKLSQIAKFKDLEIAHAKAQPPTQSELAAIRLAEVNRANQKANSESIRRALIAERRQRERERAERAAAKQKERLAIEEAEKAKLLQLPKSNLDDLFDASDRSRSGTPAALAKPSGTATPVKKPERKGIPTLRRRLMDDEIIATLDLGIDLDIEI